jgi:NRPS condensation-like uncharacterized protein
MNQARGLDPAETYYTILDRLWPMNVLCSLQLAAHCSADRIAAAWEEMGRLAPVIGARISPVAELGPSRVEFAVARPGAIQTYEGLEQALRKEAAVPIDLAAGPSTRCSVVARDGHVSHVVLAVHHAVLDGRALARLALMLGGALDEDGMTTGPLTAPTSPLSAFADPTRTWSGDRRGAIATASTFRQETGYAGNADPVSWHAVEAGVERDVEFAPLVFSLAETAAVVTTARTAGATVHGVLAAALLGASIAFSPKNRNAALYTPVDMRAVCRDDAQSVGVAASMIAGAFDATVDHATLARAVSSDVRRRIDQREPELFFAMSGIDRLRPGKQSDQVIRDWTTKAPQGICLSNLGILPEAETGAVQSLSFALAPTPNQVAFAFAATFRGRMSLTIGVDRNRSGVSADDLASEVSRRLTAGY